MLNVNRSLVTTYSQVYGAKKDINDVDLSVLDKNTWAKVLTRLNHLARTETEYSIEKVIGDWFSIENAEYANKVFQKIATAYADQGIDPRGLVTINIWSNLTLLELILKSNNQGDKTLDNFHSEKELFDIYLAINEIYGEKSDGIFATVSRDESPDIVDYLGRVTLTLLISYHDLNHFEAVELLVVNFIKSYYCLTFLVESHPDLLALFLQQYGVDTWRDYLKGILPITSHAIATGNHSGLNYLNLNGSEDKEKSRKFLDYLSLVDEYTYRTTTDFLHARSRPLFRVEEDNYLILDKVLAVNRVHNSMFFELLRLAEKNINLNPRYRDFFSLYTYDYIEKYLSYKILNKIFEKTSYFRISGEDIIAKYHIDTEPDFYVRNGNKAFIFEVKGSMLTGNSKQSFSYEIIERELKSKYLFNEDDNEKKAIAQLAERIQILFSDGAEYDKHCSSKNIRVFPILIVSELALTTPGINYLMNQWFWSEIEKHEILRSNKHRIKDLLIIEIDFLILYSEKLQQRGLFESLIHAYIKFIDKRKVRPNSGHRNKVELEKSIMNALIPFSAFVKDKIRARTPDIFMEFGKDVLKDE
ncbi:hypothetical protein [Albibacterium indicum]|uniref:hypothetical protein n=1 Tax=Albibacterium indicum TaxID=2292082 RepID=UPI000E52ECF0|nr:hypothetical protein [Pedobacter indicus]